MRTSGYQAQKEYTFVSGAYPAETFLVARFTGTEGISRLYEFDIRLASEDPEIDSRAMLQNPATFSITVGDAEIPVHGMLAKFEQLQEIDETVFYRAVLVPRLWQTSLYHENQLFLDKSVPDIIEEILNQAGLTSNDYDFRLTGTYDPWEYICQFRETDFNFISRWMEREGIYYYFEQADGIDKVIITDSSTSHEDVSGESAIPYLPPSGQVPAEEDCVHVFTCRQQMLPAKVMLKDYNYRRPTLDLKGEADVDAEGGRGTVYIYGEHFKTPETGNALAAIRAGEFLCREQLFFGESTAANLCPGFLFELTDHYRDSYNQRYLVTELTHEGKTARFLFEGERSPQAAEAGGTGYTNRFTLIPAQVQFRPERQAAKTRFYGSMNATVDAAGDGQYAEIDDEGRYKVILPFDQSGNTGGKASRWIRMVQPYAGANYGMHFPLHKGIEVLLTFVDGDPDRPIISGSVPNPDTMSPVTGGNQTRSVIRTGGKNEVALEDTDGGQLIKMSTPKENTFFRMGASNPDPEIPDGLHMNTDKQMTTNVGGHEVKGVKGDREIKIDGKTYELHTGETTREFHSNSHKITRGNQREETYGNKISYTEGMTDETFHGLKMSTSEAMTIENFKGSKFSTVDASTVETFKGLKVSSVEGSTNETFVGTKMSKCLAFTQEYFAGVKVSLSGSISFEKSEGKNLLEAPENEIKGITAIKLKCGGSGISIFPGKILIQSKHIILDGPGATIETTSKVDISGNTAISKDCKITGNMKANNFDSG